MQRFRMAAYAGALVLVSTLGLSTVWAQQQDDNQRQNQNHRRTAGMHDAGKEGKQVTLSGRIVSLHEYMTSGADAQRSTNSNAYEDNSAGRVTGTTDMRWQTATSGGPMALVSDRGLVILGNSQSPLAHTTGRDELGQNSDARERVGQSGTDGRQAGTDGQTQAQRRSGQDADITQHRGKGEVQVTGKLFEKDGVKYLEVMSVKAGADQQNTRTRTGTENQR